jgi:uncharacterized protein
MIPGSKGAKQALHYGLMLLASLWLGLAPAAAEAPARAPRPALWLLADEDTKIYLFGTVHVLPPGFEWRSAAIDRAIEESDELVMELDQEEMEGSVVGMAQRMMLGKTVPLVQRVSPGRRPTLRRMLAALGVPAETFDGLHTWAAAMALGAGGMAGDAVVEKDENGQTIQRLRGVEDALNAEFERRERPVSGVETPEQQMSFLADLPQSVQREMLEQMIDAYQSGQAPPAPTEQDWVEGNLDGLAALMEEMPPALFTVILTDRNRRWAEWLEQRLERPGTVLFAVGAGHLVGRESVQTMLEARGLTASRVD